MPSLPTSLIIVVLVAAWLVVLVPMVSKRREEVPEAEDGTANFRVLERRARRRQPVLARTARIDADGAHGLNEADNIDDEHDGDDVSLDRAALRLDDDAIDDSTESDRQDADRPVRTEAPQSIDEPAGSVNAGRRARPARREIDDETEGSARSGDRGSSRPERRRIGRGGFDPHAAERARQERFHRRRRTALVLLVLALVGAAAGAFGVGYGYAGASIFGSLLVLYFAYLRRQVRIEEEIRHRRGIRLERARQIRPQYRPSVAEQVWMHRTGETERPRPGMVPELRAHSHVRQTVPAAQYGHAVALDLDDSDPAFDDLAYYRPAARQRRAS